MLLPGLFDIFLNMYRILVILIIGFILKPQISWGQDEVLKTFIKEVQDPQAREFFDEQGAARGLWIKAHPDIIARLDAYGRELWNYRAQLSEAGKNGTTYNGPAPGPAPIEPEYEDFKAQQLAEKNAFLGKLTQEKKEFLDNHPVITDVNP